MVTRRLPHIYPEDGWLFITWHLHGSLPHGRYPPAGKLSAGQAFVWMDRYLDRAASGPMFLKQEAVAELVIGSLFKGVGLDQYYLGAFVIMSNHVHVLRLPLVAPSVLLKSLKGVTARDANKLLGRTGEPFWQRESYDHFVRNRREWERVTAYIENNLVTAGLVGSAEKYLWSSANERFFECVHMSVNAARRSACATNISTNISTSTS